VLAPLLVLFAAIAAAAAQTPALPAPAPVPDAAAPAPDVTPPATPAVEAAPSAAPQSAAGALDFAAQASVLDLSDSITPRAVNDPADPGGAWFTLPVRNGSAASAARIFTAADTAEAGARAFPSLSRPVLTEIAGSDASVVIERAPAFGDNAIRVLLPAGHAAMLALHLRGASAQPPVLAWTEPALIAHNRQIAILEGLVSGLFTAAVAFAAGAAVLSGRIFARWAALFLGAVLIAHLAAAGVFDTSWFALRGPYSLIALALAVALAAAIRMVDFIASFDAVYPGAGRWRDRVALILLVLGVLGYFGVPFVGLLLRVLAVVGASAAAGYFAHAGRLGIAGARRLAPAATIFALVSAAAAANALGLFGVNLVASGAIGGFAAAGAMLVALTTAIPMESARSRFRELREAHRNDDVQAVITDEALETQREIAAVTASHQGVFDLDLHTGLLSLSAEAAAMFGLPKGAVELSRETWLARIHQEDREIYEQALEVYRHEPGAAFRLEFRAATGHGQSEWFELRATMTGQSTEAERCLGLVGNVTARRSAEEAQEAAPAAARAGETAERVQAQSGALEAPPARDVEPLQAELRRAMREGEIELHYQPVMRLSDGAVAGFDVLLAWRDRDPGEFAAFAEESGMIGALVLFALRQAASDLARWQKGFPRTPPLFVTVNVAWRHIADKGFAKELTAVVRHDGFAAKTLKLKLTESAAPAESAQVQAVMNNLQGLGLGFAIGDFSVFNAARAHLAHVPFDTIMLDKGIVETARDSFGVAILNSSVGLARELDLATIAEGVESAGEVARLQEIGCVYGQGPLFGLPLRGGEVDGFIFTRMS
jgi:EAL domain-containing protein (putative c-di-GMP-specific phosphodiesterase class I)/PAS domain-containing protein